MITRKTNLMHYNKTLCVIGMIGIKLFEERNIFCTKYSSYKTLENKLDGFYLF